MEDPKVVAFYLNILIDSQKMSGLNPEGLSYNLQCKSGVEITALTGHI